MATDHRIDVSNMPRAAGLGIGIADDHPGDDRILMYAADEEQQPIIGCFFPPNDALLMGYRMIHEALQRGADIEKVALENPEMHVVFVEKDQPHP